MNGTPNKRFRIKTRNKYHIIKPIFQKYSPQERFQGYIWDFTLGDPDDHPSVPHAHSRVEGYRLDAWTGDIYPAGKERKDTIEKLKKTELQRLHSDPKFIAFSKKQIEWYREKYPRITFYVPDWIQLRHVQMQKNWIDRGEETGKLTFYGRAIISQEKADGNE